jgi:hypothetical protein
VFHTSCGFNSEAALPLPPPVESLVYHLVILIHIKSLVSRLKEQSGKKVVHEQGSTVLPFIIYERKFPFTFSNMGLLNGNKLGCGSGAEIEIFFTCDCFFITETIFLTAR